MGEESYINRARDPKAGLPNTDNNLHNLYKASLCRISKKQAYLFVGRGPFEVTREEEDKTDRGEESFGIIKTTWKER